MDGSTNASNVGGNVGSDTKPIKIVNGQAVAVNNDLIISGGYANYKWVLKTGYATMRFQSNVQHEVTVNLGITVADPNMLFPMVTLGYVGTSWGTINLTVGSRSSTGFKIYSWIPNTSGTDLTADVFWMAFIPITP